MAIKKRTTEEFILDAKAVHGEKYDYSATVFTRTAQKLSVNCPKHGVFSTLPSNHLKGRGCPACAKVVRAAKRLTSVEEFVRRAHRVHGKKYDYSSVQYTALSDMVCIVCPAHGEFMQSAASHLQGRGCPPCGIAERASAKNVGLRGFLARARDTHGARYDYSLVDYRTMHEKVWIVCPDHGKFHQKAANHIMGNGCPMCRNEENRRRFSHQQDAFVARAKAIHGDRLCYDDIQYKNAGTKVRLACVEHGAFEQYPVHLLRGVGCPQCGMAQRSEKLKMSLDEFFRRAKEVHRDNYRYDLVAFNNLRENVEILCKKHGRFSQVAYIHLDGAGCPKCRSSRGESAIIGWLTARRIRFIHQWSAHDCIINVNPAKFDFFLPDIDVIIEFDGEQHFKPVKFGGSISSGRAQSRFESQQVADLIKNEWAKDNGLQMLRIRFDEDVRERLDDLLSPLLLTTQPAH